MFRKLFVILALIGVWSVLSYARVFALLGTSSFLNDPPSGVAIKTLYWNGEEATRKKYPSGANVTAEIFKSIDLSKQFYCYPIRPNESEYDVVVENEGVQFMSKLTESSWWRNLLCERIKEAKKKPGRKLLYNITFNSRDLFQAFRLGTGNLVYALYLTRLIAHIAGDVDVAIYSSDGDVAARDLILPWLTGLHRATPKQGLPLHIDNSKLPTLEQICSSAKPLALMLPEIQYELRRMAIAVVGIPSADHPSAAFSRHHLIPNLRNSSFSVEGYLYTPMPSEGPFFPNVELDDTVIHFRCGDLMTTNHPQYKFNRFEVSARHVPSTTRTIGILTQPFHKGNFSRSEDNRQDHVGDRCRVIVSAYVDYLHEHFPEARIRIHNRPDESLTVAWSRLIMANASIASGVSTFANYPIMSTFGTGVLQTRAGAPGNWMLFDTPRADQISNNLEVKAVPEDRISGKELEEMWKSYPDGEDRVVAWFRNDTSPS
jgi:hypothetical protein